MRAIPLATTMASLVLLLGLGGCKNKHEYPACSKDKHCEGEEPCIDNICQQCQADPDCAGMGAEGEDLACVNFRCEAPGGESVEDCGCDPGLVCNAGACEPCTDGSQCESGVCNASGRCEAMPCTTDDDCPMDEICDGGQCLYHPLDGPGDEAVCGLPPMYFGFDSSQLSPGNQEQLSAAAACLSERFSGGEGTLVLEAHADNVGTTEYNVLLTDKRGATVKEFLSQQGVPADSIRVVGKGSLEATGNDESTRAQDRRVEFIVE